MNSQPLVTVFTCAAYFDIARIWHACVTRAFPPGEARVEIFVDSDVESPDLRYFPNVTVIRQGPSRRDFQEAYNDALTRVETPFLAFIDSDVYWVSDTIWPFLKSHLVNPNTAAISCITRNHRESHGTFSVVMKSDIYRKVLKSVPGGFLPANEYMDIEVPTQRWRWFDTGDLATAAVREAGYEVKLMRLDETGAVVMFRNITVFRRPADCVGFSILNSIKGHYFWRGYIGNLMLKRLHDNLFSDGPRYRFPLNLRFLLRQAVQVDPREMLWRYRYLRSRWRDAEKVRQFIQDCRDPNL
jgi:hypothetical protein